MADPSPPKGRPDAPAEGPTRAFRVKFDDWMTELMAKDLGLTADAPAASGDAAPAELGQDGEHPQPPGPSAAAAGATTEGAVPGERTGRSSG